MGKIARWRRELSFPDKRFCPPYGMIEGQFLAASSATLAASEATRLHNGFFIEPGAAADPGRG
ncbi:MAG TPA: hypothetical protein VKD43_03510, partial [Xanthobacteraceae bacterium]|nr:hypothetical protein [Xanthobacteraceae bacterium]